MIEHLSLAAVALFTAFLAVLHRRSREEPAPTPQMPPEAPKPPVAATSTPAAPVAPPAPQTVPATVPESELSWFEPKGAFKLTRIMCDKRGLTLAEKNIVCACLFQESRFKNDAVCLNRDKSGRVWSKDISIAQVNTYFHVGPGKRFPSEAYLLAHPEKGVAWVVDTMASTGKLQPWVSYTTGAYKQWLKPGSAMWKLKT